MFGQRLRLARKKAGLSMRELARCMSPPVSAQAISKYEAGKMMPSSRVLVGLGQTLNASLDFLMGGQVEAMEAVEFRKHSRTSAKDRARAEVLVTEKLENYLAIEYILELEPAPDPFQGLPVRSGSELGGSGVSGEPAERTMESRLGPHPQHDRPARIQGDPGDRSRLAQTLRRFGLHGQACRRPA